MKEHIQEMMKNNPDKYKARVRSLRVLGPEDDGQGLESLQQRTQVFQNMKEEASMSVKVVSEHITKWKSKDEYMDKMIQTGRAENRELAEALWSDKVKEGGPLVRRENGTVQIGIPGVLTRGAYEVSRSRTLASVSNITSTLGIDTAKARLSFREMNVKMSDTLFDSASGGLYSAISTGSSSSAAPLPSLPSSSGSALPFSEDMLEKQSLVSQPVPVLSASEGEGSGQPGTRAPADSLASVRTAMAS